MPNSSAICERLDVLHDQWVSFADSQARLLIWRVAEGEAAMIDAFLARECDPDRADTPDLFLQLASPFVSVSEHSQLLADELTRQYEGATQASAAPAHEPPWRAPRAKEGEDGVAFLVRVLTSFREHAFGEGSQAKLAVWLDPGEISAVAPYQQWLQRLAQQAPSELRFIVLDGATDRQYAPLVAAEPERVVERTCSLDMPAAVHDVARGGDNNKRGDRFRMLETQLGAAIADGDLDESVRVSAVASEFAKSEGWLHLAAVVQMMLATGFAAHDKHHEALRAYAEAERLGAAREKEEAQTSPAGAGTPQVGGAIRLQARLGQGAVLVHLKAFKQAAEAYLAAAAIANSLSDARSELDGYRLASVSYAEHGDARLAWEVGMRGFQLGLAMDEPTRKTSTLLYLADHLLRMTHRHEAYEAHRRPLEQQLAKLLGADWRSQLVVTKAA